MADADDRKNKKKEKLSPDKLRAISARIQRKTEEGVSDTPAETSAPSASVDEQQADAQFARPSSFEPSGKVLDSYFFDAEGTPVNVKIIQTKDFVPIYFVLIPGLGEGTKIVLNTLKGELITEVKLDIAEMVDPKMAPVVKRKFEEKSNSLLSRHFPTLSDETKRVLSSYLIQNTLGLGDLEAPMHDDKLEEIVVNGSGDPVWIFHKKYGWCKTNIRLRGEENIYDYAAMIGRKIGKQINVLNPLMDAHLTTGDRVNATLFPVSTCGNTITIRKFSRNPWTITTLTEIGCITPEVAGLIWLCIQNEMSLLISGGTGSGKTSFLNAISCLIPPNQRVLSIEDTRELTLPSFLQWVPMTTREANPEGKGEITMLDLLVNALRQRPDRIIVGEVRRQREAEILFEAMHTGHSVYATLHADNAAETISRLTTPPINMPKTVLDALAGIVVQFRHRKLGLRRTLEFAEVTKGGDAHVMYRWDVKTDKLNEVAQMSTLSETLNLYAGLTSKEIRDDTMDKASVISWMVKQGIRDVDGVGKVVAQYYLSPEEVLAAVKANRPLNI
ncbi:Type II/IV secretion system protein [Candidatus Gugararchaeum adminiculabundum]|nr:Type II/IV secretion system protein [Candidatus Gugararchaeum adminiculabundum]